MSKQMVRRNKILYSLPFGMALPVDRAAEHATQPANHKIRAAQDFSRAMQRGGKGRWAAARPKKARSIVVRTWVWPRTVQSAVSPGGDVTT